MTEHLDRAQEFARRLEKLFGDELISVGLYGSAARGQYRPGSSDLNLLVVLRELDAERLRRAAALTREWVAAGDPPPLLFSEAEWLGSEDVFPVEYSDIRDAHLVLHGSDPFAGLEVRWEHLRLLCEHELKGKKIRLREGYLLTVEVPEELGTMLTQSLSSFLAVFRAVLRLLGEVPPAGAEEVVDRLAAEAGFDPAPLRKLLGEREAGGKYAPSGEDPEVVGYLAAVTRVSDWLDTLVRPQEVGKAVG